MQQYKATLIAVLLHGIGLGGFIFYDKDLFAFLTVFNLLASAGLLIYTQKEKNPAFFLFAGSCYIVGFTAEYIGVNQHWLFGEFEFSEAMGIQWQKVPLIIGIYWFIIMYCCAVSIQMLLNVIWNKLRDDDQPYRSNVGFAAVILDSALLAVFFDWVMEPVAVKLGYWKWLGNGDVPMLNYLSWLGVSALLMLLFRLLPFNKQNQFAVNLLLIQFMFFLILHTTL